MRLVTYCHEGRISVGVLHQNCIVDVAAVRGSGCRLCPTMVELLEEPGALGMMECNVRTIAAELAHARPNRPMLVIPTNQVTILAPVLRPTKVIGVGMNYRSFVDALGERPPKYPILFNKTSSALTGHGSSIVLPHVTDEAVPEGELAVIIGKRGSFLTAEQAMEHVAGFTCANDVSARNLEFRTSQWTSGKMLATFCPLGPALVTRDEVGDPKDLEVRTVLNGQTVQCGRTSDMIFDIPQLIAEISCLVTLEPGDVILTGTPSDLGDVDPPVFLRAGDTVSVHVEGIGVLSNTVAATTRAGAWEAGR
jgi:2-keto-4-pentenoate hydratase/2-oxohepta-3-ene-1,7-dioic acid hydratase in catechol pathway